MKKVILGTLLGLIISIGGFGLLFYSLTGLNGFLGIIGMIGGLVTVVVGVFLLYKAGTRDVQKLKFSVDSTHPKPVDGPSVLQKNSELVSQYYKTAEARDKLKILQVASNAENK